MPQERMISVERQNFNQWLDKFSDMIPKYSTVLDIGKSHLHDYAPYFKGHNYKTVDRDPSKKPEVLVDVEKPWAHDPVDAIICNGVLEQSDDPVQVIRGVTGVLKVGGWALFGIISVGYPLFERDFCRFTPNGVIRILNMFGMEILDFHIINREQLPSYIFSICRKRE